MNLLLVVADRRMEQDKTDGDEEEEEDGADAM